jgi:hypothetical protein
MFLSTCSFYQRCVLRNRVKTLAVRLRQPKYVIGLLLTVTYFGWIFGFNPAFRPDASRSPEEVRANAMLVGTGLYVVQVVLAWFASSSGRGVVFREAEVQFLFPRPLTRWQILLFKWWNAQPAALIGSLITGLMFNRFGDLSYPCVVAGFWINQTVLYAHSTLVGLWLAHLKAKGGLAARWTSMPAWALLIALVAGAASGWQQVGDSKGWAAAQVLVHSPWLAAVIAPFTSMANLMMTSDPVAFGVAAVIPLSLLAVQAWLVWWMDFRFEDQAVEIAAKIQNIKGQGIGALQSKTELIVAKPGLPWELAPTGPAWKALVWKNVISLGRLPRRLAISLGIVLLIIVAVIGSLAVTKGDAPHMPTRIGFVVLALMGYVSVLAPSLVRVDLRIDIPHFDVLKAMPLRGRSLIFGEVMGSVAVLWAIQVIGCLAAAILISSEGKQTFLWIDKAPAVLGAVCVFFALDFAMLTAENLMALWLPGFVRLGRGMNTGFDRIGQNLMGALIRLLGLFVLFVVPAIVGAGVGAILHAIGLRTVPSAALGGIAFAALLCFEAWLMICTSERRYERFDLTSEHITAESE